MLECLVMCYEDRAKSDGMRGNLHVQRLQRPAQPLLLGAQCAIRSSRFPSPGLNPQTGEKPINDSPTVFIA